MKKHLHVWATCTLAAIATAIVWAAMINVPATAQVAIPPTNQTAIDQPAAVDQNRTRNDQYSNRTDRTMTDRQACKASDIVGMEVRSANDEKIGSINDLMVQHDGNVAYAAVSFGGFLGVGDKLFAVPWEAIHFVKKDNNKVYAHIDVTEQTLKDRQGFDKDHWPEKADGSFLTGAQRQVERPVTGPTTVPR